MLKRSMTASKLVLWKYGQMYSETELAVESYGNVQFYSIPNIDGAMDRQSQKGVYDKG